MVYRVLILREGRVDLFDVCGPWFEPYVSSVQNSSQLSGNSKLGLKAKLSAQICEQISVVDTHNLLRMLPSPGSAI